MKNTLKLFGIIAFVTVIGFTMAACGDGDDGGGGGSSNTIPSELLGRWYSGTSVVSLTYTLDSTSITKTGGFRNEVISVSKITNDNASTKDEYPSGYAIVVEGLTGGSGTTYNVFLNNDKTAARIASDRCYRAYSWFEDGYTLSDANSALGLNLSSPGQSTVVNVSTLNEVDSKVEVYGGWELTNRQYSFIETKLQGEVDYYNYLTETEKTTILNTLNSKNYVVFAKFLVSGTKVWVYAIKRQ
jgi:hypothetical protein